MIIGFFITLITTIVTFLLSILPVYDMPAEWIAAVNLIWGYLNAMSFLLPVSTLLTVLGIALFFHVTIFGWNFAIKIYHMIRG